MIYLDVHSHKQHSDAGMLVIRNQYPLSCEVEEPFSVGIHPWYCEDWQEQLRALHFVVRHPNCFAIGECGLDRVCNTDFALQMQIFKEQIVLSERLELPLIIHCVRAYSEIVSVKKQIQPKQLWVLHGFHKNEAVARLLTQNGIVLSFGKALLCSEKVQKVFTSLEEGSYFFETDDAAFSVKEIYAKAKSWLT
ncbi:TatD family hydrolase [Capnocytophaga haemolytica]